MDLHPTPFPGKRRPAANLASKNGNEQPKPASSLPQSKPKRAFGRNLSGNIPVERPLKKSITSKPWKPSGVSKKAITPPKKLLSALSCAEGAKSEGRKKAQHVTFREIPPPDEIDDLVLSTPVFLTDPQIPETPFQSAENCSKCRLDRLESSSYWISQIKLAECTGKHFVSAAFFRLALDCKAQPFVCLQNELKHYKDRHGVIFTGTLWDDLCRDYGFTSDDCDSFDAVIVEQFHSKVTVSEHGDCTVDRDISVGYDIIDKLDDLEAKNNVPEETIDSKHFEDRSQEARTPFQDSDNLNSNSVASRNVFGDRTSDDSAENSEKNKTIDSDKNVGQAAAKNSGSWSEMIKETGDKMGSNDLFKRKTEEKCKDESVKSVVDEDNLESREKAAPNQFLDDYLSS